MKMRVIVFVLLTVSCVFSQRLSTKWKQQQEQNRKINSILSSMNAQIETLNEENRLLNKKILSMAERIETLKNRENNENGLSPTRHRSKRSSSVEAATTCRIRRDLKQCIVQIVRSHLTQLLNSGMASHYENLPMQYTEIFIVVKIENFQ